MGYNILAAHVRHMKVINRQCKEVVIVCLQSL